MSAAFTSFVQQMMPQLYSAFLSMQGQSQVGQPATGFQSAVDPSMTQFGGQTAIDPSQLAQFGGQSTMDPNLLAQMGGGQAGLDPAMLQFGGQVNPNASMSQLLGAPADQFGNIPLSGQGGVMDPTLLGQGTIDPSLLGQATGLTDPSQLAQLGLGATSSASPLATLDFSKVIFNQTQNNVVPLAANGMGNSGMLRATISGGIGLSGSLANANIIGAPTFIQNQTASMGLRGGGSNMTIAAGFGRVPTSGNMTV